MLSLDVEGLGLLYSVTWLLINVGPRLALSELAFRLLLLRHFPLSR